MIGAPATIARGAYASKGIGSASSRRLFARRKRGDGKCVDVGLHHVADRLVDQPVPPYDRQARKSFRNEPYGEMPMAVRSTRMAGVQVTVVDHLHCRRLQRCSQPRLESLGTGCAIAHGRTHGRAFTNGRTSYDSNTPSVT